MYLLIEKDGQSSIYDIYTISYADYIFELQYVHPYTILYPCNHNDEKRLY